MHCENGLSRLSLEPSALRQHAFRWIAACAVIFLAATAFGFQDDSASPVARAAAQQRAKAAARKSAQRPAQKPAQREDPFATTLEKYPGLMDELVRLQERLQRELRVPASRSQSRILPLLAEGTQFYCALPNYGDAAQQALQVFQSELQTSAVLHNWWQDIVGADGAKILDGVEKFYQLSQYVGDELVISSPDVNQANSVFVVAEVRKPGLHDLIAQLGKEFGGKSPLRVLTPQQLAVEKAQHSPGDPIVLVRPDFVVAALDLATLRRVNAQLDHHSGAFVATPFGARLAQSYHSGTTMLLGLDLQKLIKETSTRNAKQQSALQSTGFADLKYAIWEFRTAGGPPPEIDQQMELTFNGPRHGVASWLASSAALGGLDFISPKSFMVADFRLKSPALILDDVREIAGSANPGGLAMLDQTEQGLHISIKNDLLRKLTGEIAFEISGPTEQDPQWRIVLGTNDAPALQQSLEQLAAGMGMAVKHHQEDGFASSSIHIPNSPKPVDVHFAFVDGYLVIAPGHKLLAEATRMHRGGESLAKSQDFRASLPPGRSTDASAVIYEDVAEIWSTTLRQASPEVAQLLAKWIGPSKPVMMRLYGDESAIRMTANSGGYNPGMVLMIAAIAIPNMLRARMAANESAAVSTVRMVVTAQVAYSSNFPRRGYSRDLAALGPGPKGDCDGEAGNPAHACLIDGELAVASCASGTWCAKGAYRYSVSATCGKQVCDDFVVVATPVDASHAARNFCAISDGIVRSQTGPPLDLPVSLSECRSWSPVH